MVDPWKETTLPTILRNYDKRDIYNADEFGLFYQALPKKSLHLRNEKCSGGKHSKIRLTGMAAANMLGEKLPMFVIGKAVKPRCFKNIKQRPSRYRAQKRSWMNSELFEEWVRELDKKFESENRKIALIVDNCPAHPEIEGLKAIDLFFLPPNTTSHLQPMDQGVIRSLKAKYRQKVIRKIIDAIDKGNMIPNISILEGMKILTLSWEEVSISTFINCFSKAGFSDATVELEDDPFRDLMSSVEELRVCDSSQVPEDITIEDIVLIDDQTIASQPYMNDREILADILDEEIQEEEVDENDEMEILSNDEPNKPTQREVREAMDILLNFTLFTDNKSMKALAIKCSNSVEAELDKSTKQTCITSFFNSL